MTAVTAEQSKMTPDIDAQRQGAKLAIQMMARFNLVSLGVLSLDNEWRNNGPQDNVVLIYLKKLRELNDAQADIAFAACLTDFIGMMLYCGIPTDKHYRECARRFAPKRKQSTRAKSLDQLPASVEVTNG